MREILFRGKRVDSGEWVNGYYASIGEYQYILTGKLELIPSPNFEHFLVNPETVSQFTGLLDCNGARIFEGDIVTGRFQDKKITGCVKYGDDASFYIYRKGLFNIGLNNADIWLTVIGNIYDSPEL